MAGKKGKKGKKQRDPQMTPQEAILAYQINVVEQKLEDISYEIRGWEEKNQRNRERNEKLKHEEEELLGNLLKANRDRTGSSPEEDIRTRDDVSEIMREKWERQKERVAELEELKNQIAVAEVEIQTVEEEVNWWRAFRDTGQKKLKLEIRVLEEELQDIQTSFQDMTARLSRDKAKVISEIEEDTEKTLSQQTDKATQKAMDQLNKKDRQEMLDNDWLHTEIGIHRRENQKMSEVVEMLEQENLELLSKLFECTVEDLKVSRSFFMSQFSDCENLDRAGILEMDLASINVPCDEMIEQQVLKSVSDRPKSAIQKAVEDKVFSLDSYRSSQDDSNESTDEGDCTGESESDFCQNVCFEEEDFEDYLQLGPLELKLLCVTGQQMPIHHLKPEEEIESKKWNPDKWPVTQPMLKGLFLPGSK